MSRLQSSEDGMQLADVDDDVMLQWIARGLQVSNIDVGIHVENLQVAAGTIEGRLSDEHGNVRYFDLRIWDIDWY